MRRNTVMAATLVYASTVRVGDIVRVNGVSFIVRDMFAVVGGGKRLIFHGGHSYLLSGPTSLVALRRRRMPGR